MLGDYKNGMYRPENSIAQGDGGVLYDSRVEGEQR